MSRNRFNRHVFWWTDEAQKIQERILNAYEPSTKAVKEITAEELNAQAKRLLEEKLKNYPEIDSGEETVEGIINSIKDFYGVEFPLDLLCDIAIEVSEYEKNCETEPEVLPDTVSVPEETNTETETQTETVKKKVSRHWYNNGITQVLATECPEGYVAGKLKKASE